MFKIKLFIVPSTFQMKKIILLAMQLVTAVLGSEPSFRWDTTSTSEPGTHYIYISGAQRVKGGTVGRCWLVGLTKGKFNAYTKTSEMVFKEKLR